MFCVARHCWGVTWGHLQRKERGRAYAGSRPVDLWARGKGPPDRGPDIRPSRASRGWPWCTLTPPKRSGRRDQAPGAPMCSANSRSISARVRWATMLPPRKTAWALGERLGHETDRHRPGKERLDAVVLRRTCVKATVYLSIVVATIPHPSGCAFRVTPTSALSQGEFSSISWRTSRRVKWARGRAACRR